MVDDGYDGTVVCGSSEGSAVRSTLECSVVRSS